MAVDFFVEEVLRAVVLLAADALVPLTGAALLAVAFFPVDFCADVDLEAVVDLEAAVFDLAAAFLAVVLLLAVDFDGVDLAAADLEAAVDLDAADLAAALLAGFDFLAAACLVAALFVVEAALAAGDLVAEDVVREAGLAEALGSFFAPETKSLRLAPGRNFGTAVFFARIRSPVWGLRTMRAGRMTFSKAPKPVMATFSPLVTSRVTVSRTASSAC